MTLTAVDTAMGGLSGPGHSGPTVQGSAADHRRTSPPARRTRPQAAVRSVLIYDARPDARAALTLRVTTAVPSADDITCAESPAELITAFGGRPADLVFIGVESQPGDGETVAPFLCRYPTARVIAVGTITDTPALTTALARGAIGLMLWYTRHDHLGLPPRRRVRSGTRDYPVTHAERGILQGMSRGLSNREIGVHLRLSEETVKSRTRVLYRKLGARDRAHAVALALRDQLLS